MATQGIHDTYTRQTRHVLHWLINTSNSVIESLEDGSAGMEINTTGETTADDIPRMARLIAENLSPSEIPDLSIYLLNAIIQDRLIIHRACTRLEKITNNPSRELVESNKSHKYFIERLLEAFSALDGPSRITEQRAHSAISPSQDDLERLARSANRFSAISIDSDSQSDSDQSGPSPGPGPQPASRQTSTKHRKKSKGPRRKTGKGRGRKGSSRKNKQVPQEDAAAKPCPREIPLESCRIIGDIDSAYHIAIRAFLGKWIELRSEVQNSWRDVAYRCSNSVVATGVSHLAVAMVKQSELALAVDFPGLESYQTVMGNLTGGEPDKYCVSLRVTRGSSSGGEQETTTVNLDMKEHVMVYTFRDLLDFLVDYNKYPKGRPTMRTWALIQSLDLQFDLQKATPAQRVSWRRVYTIKWLYGLIDASSSTKKDKPLFGLKEFADTIMYLAETTPGKNIGHRIMPHHVFQLQCIIDSFTVSRGWFVSSLGHVMSSPACTFWASRDIDLWMLRRRPLAGLVRLYNTQRLKALYGDYSAALGTAKLLWQTHLEFISQSMSSRSTDGIWEHSPFVCGAGLLEILDTFYSIGLSLLNNTPEVLMVIHLHNMLVQQGFLKEPVELYTTMTQWLAPSFFGDRGSPTSGFAELFLNCTKVIDGRNEATEGQSSKREASKTTTEIHRNLDLEANRQFKTQSFLGLCGRADWIPDGIPDEDLCPASILYSYRVSHTEPITDPTTGEQRLEATPLVLNAKNKGISEETLVDKCKVFWKRKRAQGTVPKSASTDGDQTHESPDTPSDGPRSKSPDGRSGEAGIPMANMLALLMCDLTNDVEGAMPRSSLDLTEIAAHCVMLFEKIEESLYQLRNPVYVKAYELQNPFGWEKRVAFTYLALLDRDDDCLEAVAAAFELTRARTGQFMYFGDKTSPPHRKPYDADLGKFLDALFPVM
ncbi:hypothetical protein PG984_006937 [Apiospora sp. TS-2023a]